MSPERIGRSKPTGSNAHTASPPDPLSCLKIQMLFSTLCYPNCLVCKYQMLSIHREIHYYPKFSFLKFQMLSIHRDIHHYPKCSAISTGSFFPNFNMLSSIYHLCSLTSIACHLIFFKWQTDERERYLTVIKLRVKF